MVGQTLRRTALDDVPSRDHALTARRSRILAGLLIAGAFVPTMIAVIAGTATLNEPTRAAPPLLTGPPGYPIIIGTGASEQALPVSSASAPAADPDDPRVNSGRPVGRIVARENPPQPKPRGSSPASPATVTTAKPTAPTAAPAVTSVPPVTSSSSGSDPSTGSETSPSVGPSTSNDPSPSADPNGSIVPTGSSGPPPAAVTPSVGDQKANGATTESGTKADAETPEGAAGGAAPGPKPDLDAG